MAARDVHPDTVASVAFEGVLGDTLRDALAHWALDHSIALQGAIGKEGPFRLAGPFHQLRQVLPGLRQLMTSAGRAPTFTLSPFSRAA